MLNEPLKLSKKRRKIMDSIILLYVTRDDADSGRAQGTGLISHSRLLLMFLGLLLLLLLLLAAVEARRVLV